MLAGGGARGAYEAGVLSVLLPALERDGRMPKVIVGTSVGAVNAAHLAATAHLGAEAATAGMVERWCSLRMSHVLRPLLAGQAVRTALAYVSELVGVPGVTLRSRARPRPARRDARPLDRLERASSQHSHGAAEGARGGGHGRAERAKRRLRRGHGRGRAVRVPRRRLRVRAYRCRARARLGGDPRPVPGRPNRAAGALPRLVLRRRHATQHADQAGPRHGRGARGRGHDQLTLQAAGGRPGRAARLRPRHRRARSGHARRSARGGHSAARQDQPAGGRREVRRVHPLAGAAREGARIASSPTSSSRRRGRASWGARRRT